MILRVYMSNINTENNKIIVKWNFIDFKTHENSSPSILKSLFEIVLFILRLEKNKNAACSPTIQGSWKIGQNGISQLKMQVKFYRYM